MNANELTEIIEHLENARYIGASKAATMLRQQQAEIEALKTRIERMIENQSHHEGIAHAGGFEAGWQAAKRTPLSDQELLKMAADKFHYTEYKLAIEFARAIELAYGIGE